MNTKTIVEAEYVEDLIRKVEKALNDMLSECDGYTAYVSVIIEVIKKP